MVKQGEKEEQEKPEEDGRCCWVLKAVAERTTLCIAEKTTDVVAM